MEDSKQVLQDPELLVQRYCESRRPDLRDMILVQFSPVVERTARKFAGIEPFEDLVQVGYIGLLNALGKFDPNAGVRFGTYATHLIAGEMKHYLRDKSQVIRHPAWLQELRHKVNKAATRFQAEEGRAPTNAEIASRCGVSESAVEDVFNTADLLKVSSYDAALPGDEESNELDNVPAYTTESLGVEDRLVLDSAMEQLRDLEREVLVAFHFESMSQTEIAAKLGISGNYVSHILRQSLNKLRRILNQEEERDRKLKRKRNVSDEGISDPILGVYRESYLRTRLEEEVHRSGAHATPVGLVILQFDGLESLANYYGADAVVDFLADAADHAREQVRRLDVACRVGEHGLAIILPMTGPTTSVVATRLRQRFEPWLSQRRSPGGTVTLSIGCAFTEGEVRKGAHLLAAAQDSLQSGQAAVQTDRAA